MPKPPSIIYEISKMEKNVLLFSLSLEFCAWYRKHHQMASRKPSRKTHKIRGRLNGFQKGIYLFTNERTKWGECHTDFRLRWSKMWDGKMLEKLSAGVTREINYKLSSIQLQEIMYQILTCLYSLYDKDSCHFWQK